MDVYGGFAIAMWFLQSYHPDEMHIAPTLPTEVRSNDLKLKRGSRGLQPTHQTFPGCTLR